MNYDLTLPDSMVLEDRGKKVTDAMEAMKSAESAGQLYLTVAFMTFIVEKQHKAIKHLLEELAKTPAPVVVEEPAVEVPKRGRKVEESVDE